MINKEIATIFNTFADIYEIMEDELSQDDKQIKFKIRAYRQAAVTLENYSKDLKQVIANEEENLKDLPGIGAAFASKIKEYIKTGKIQEFEDLQTMIPEGILRMLDISGVGPKKVKLFYSELGITSLDQLAQAIEAGRVQELPRMGEKSAQNILDGIDRLQNQPDRTPLGTALPEVINIINDLKQADNIDRITYAGSARRQKTTIGDIDIICSTTQPEQIAQHFKGLPYIDDIIAEGETKISVYLKSGIQVDLRIVEPDQFGAALQYFTGSKAHNVKLRSIAKKLGYKISEYGIFQGDELVGGKDEEDIYITLNMETPPPELRENTGEIELAQKNKIPQLITTENIKGDLHCHSTYSDGKNSIQEMAEAAEKLGYEYIAITDHSPALGVANGLSPERLREKRTEIDKLNQNDQIKIKILYGTEVDILSDGSIDYEDAILKEFDIVVASIHSKLKQDNTDRIIKAMENPHVHIIGHPSTRLLLKRDPSPNDWTKIYQAAAKTGTILEINSNPKRLDLEGPQIREAKKHGCKFSVNTDSHNINNLQFMKYGIGQARRGYLEPEDVINTYSWSQLQKQIK